MSRIPGIAGSPRWSFACLLLASLALVMAPSLAQEPKKDESKQDEPKKDEPKKAEKKARKREPGRHEVMDYGRFLTATIKAPSPRDNNAMKGIAIKLGHRREAGGHLLRHRPAAGLGRLDGRLPQAPRDALRRLARVVAGDQRHRGLRHQARPRLGQQGRRLQGPPPRAVRPPAGRLGQVQGAVPERRQGRALVHRGRGVGPGDARGRGAGRPTRPSSPGRSTSGRRPGR